MVTQAQGWDIYKYTHNKTSDIRMAIDLAFFHLFAQHSTQHSLYLAHERWKLRIKKAAHYELLQVLVISTSTATISFLVMMLVLPVKVRKPALVLFKQHLLIESKRFERHILLVLYSCRY